jgi:cysteinyl-tRNA synthetase
MKIFNTQTKEKEEFVPLEGKRVKMYVCGPTVYDHAHLGHARAAVAFDIIRRFLEHEGYHVMFVQNFTDVDDKIIKKATEEKASISEVARRYAISYLQDMAALHVRRADFYPLATENIPLMQEIIQKLIDKGHGYVGDHGDVYFDTESFPQYGQLSKRPKQEMESLGAQDKGLSEKKNPKDFALWKARATENEVGWESPWGYGRPGWHIECSTMNLQYLGESIDIHGGGQDLIFPHHENEAAQCEALTGKPFVKYWVHNGFVNVNHTKMSKSLGNFFTIKDLLKEFTGDQLRLFLLTSYYRKPIEFSLDIMREKVALNQRIEAALDFLENRLIEGGMTPILLYNEAVRGDYGLPVSNDNEEKEDFLAKLVNLRHKFLRALQDDFNTPMALAELMNLVKIIQIWANPTGQNSPIPDLPSLRFTYIVLKEMLDLFGLYPNATETANPAAKYIEQFINAKISERTRARKEKDFKKSDAIRAELNKLAVEIQDFPDRSTWNWKKI